MVDTSYISERIDRCDEIEISSHAEERAELRGLSIEKVREALSEGEILGARPNENPNVEISYTESYLVLISGNGELYYLPLYFQEDRAVVTTVLKLSESNKDLLEW